jgi:L-histidine N-alpha-methyltransferase
MNLQGLLKPGDGILLGVDLLKSPNRLHHAYNDREGVTADFNLNLLRRINSELSANFDRNQFEHYAFYNPYEKRIEMHLISLIDQSVTVAGHSFHFAKGETIHTENSYKYTAAEISQMCRDCGFHQQQTWTDAKDLFSIGYFSR